VNWDRQTLDAYDASVADYEACVGDAPDATLEAFLDDLPDDAYVLDFGCGPGLAAARMLARGMSVDAIDASAKMVAAAQTRGVPARQARFEDPLPMNTYDGVWASFSLLHAPRDAFPGHLAAIHAALKPRGQLHLGMKTGQGEERDRLGRYYVYYTPQELMDALEAAGFHVTAVLEGRSKGLAGDEHPFALLSARG
jgi:SAM-dependent methyltransferase